MEYVYPQDVLPEMEYTKPEVKRKRCGTCTHGYVTNAGAVIPGYHCKLMEKLFKEAGYDNGNECVNSRFGICKHYKNRAEAKAEAQAERVRGAGI